MPAHHPAAPRPARGREEDQRRRLVALRARLPEAARALSTEQDWARCLHLGAGLPGEDFANILLICAQRPDATLVGDYQHWQARGRQVRRNEKGIEIFAHPPPPPGATRPGREDGARGQDWRDADRVAYVWDVSQTTGRPIGSRPRMPPGQEAAGMWDALCWLARREGFAIEREHGAPADGVTFWAVRRIRILPAASGEQAIWALAHQLGHVLLHRDHAGPPGVTTAGCAGVRKIEADSVAFIACARHHITAHQGLSYPASWAGRDPRAQPEAAILAAGQRITTAASKIVRHTDLIVFHETPGALASGQEPTTLAGRAGPRPHRSTRAPASATGTPAESAGPATGPPDVTARILADAHTFYTSQLAGSWVPAYLDSRGISPAVARDWGTGYAPGGWTTLTGHLRRRGHHDDAIEAAGLASRSSRGTLIDRFRDRVILPVHAGDGTLRGFIGRAHPDAGDSVPRYINSPETAVYKKSELLFGLHHARGRLAAGAIPVLVEGPFDAIAVGIASPGRHIGLAPCGTALTSHQALALARASNLRRAGALVAFDDDTAGREAAIRAYGILRPFGGNLQMPLLDGQDPAEILQRQGRAALQAVLRERLQPLSALLIDTSIESWGRRLRDTDGPYLAMIQAAGLIAGLLPAGAAQQIRRTAAARTPEEVARIMPAESAYLVVRTASKLGFDCCDVLDHVADAANHGPRFPKAPARVPGTVPDPGPPAAASLAAAGFPHRPLATTPSHTRAPRRAVRAVRPRPARPGR
jgi:DNA primase